MKKLILSAAFLTFAGLTAVQASEIPTNRAEIVTVQDSVIKTPIKLEELPDAVKATLQSAPYKDWAAVAAFHVKDGEKEYFQIDVKKQEETASLKLNKEGKPVE